MMDYEEKRDFIRMQAECKMTYRLADTRNYHEGTCVNLSGSGILFNGDTSVNAGAAMEVRLEPDNRITPPLIAYIEVTRCMPEGENRFSIAGLIKGIKGG
jgi:hypothetical protein